MRTEKPQNEIQETARYARYYEHDGMLRAYANRAMFLAILFGIIAFASLGFAIYVRVQPPTVIRVDKDGNATVVGGGAKANPTRAIEMRPTAQAASPDSATSTSTAPTDLEGKAVIRRFLDRDLSYTPDSAARNLA